MYRIFSGQDPTRLAGFSGGGWRLPAKWSFRSTRNIPRYGCLATVDLLYKYPHHHVICCTIDNIKPACHLALIFLLPIDHPHVRQMPTPSDSTTSLPLERERSTHATCPPEDDRSGQWTVEVLHELGRAAIEPTFDSGAIRPEEGSLTGAASPGPLESSLDQSEDKPSDHATDVVTLMDPAEASPHSGGASPSNLHGHDKELEPHVPKSSALDLQYSIRYGIDSTRVSKIIRALSINLMLTDKLADPNAYFVHAPRWEQVPRYAAVGQPEIQRGGRHQDC